MQLTFIYICIGLIILTATTGAKTKFHWLTRLFIVFFWPIVFVILAAFLSSNLGKLKHREKEDD